MQKTFATIILATCLILSCAAVSGAQDDAQYKIKVGSSEFIPDKQFHPGSDIREDERAVLQFYRIPGRAEISELKSKGITLGRYVGGNAYVANVKSRSALNDNVRSITPYTPEMKLSRHFKNSPELKEMTESNRMTEFYIRFFDGSSSARAKEILNSRSLEITESYWESEQALQVKADWSAIQELTALGEIETVSPGRRKRKAYNADAAKRSGADQVRSSANFMGVNGAVNIGVWDSGSIDGNHRDLAGRVTKVQGSSNSWHATGVAGVIGGSGAGKNAAKGMAPGAKFFSYNYFGDVYAEIRSAVNIYGILASNHSWGYVVGWDEEYIDGDYEPIHYSDYWFGVYDSDAATVDRLVIDTDTLFVTSAGNDRNDGFIGPHYHDDDDDLHEDLHDFDPDYSSISSFANAKNVLTVGATTKDLMYTGFSSWGPVEDGRVKPDVVAVGQGMTTPVPGNKYAIVDGTSFSAPVVTGGAALLYDYFIKKHGATPSSATIKNLIIHSARDIGPAGVDYMYGHGAIDVELAARVIKNSSLSSAAFTGAGGSEKALMLDGSVQNNQQSKISFNVPSSVKELRVSLVWHDPAGDDLTNDLDLVLQNPSGSNVSQLILDPSNPSAAAANGTNSRDNVENIKVENPASGIWDVKVQGDRITNGSQKYSLIVSFSGGNRSQNLKSSGAVSIEKMFLSSSDDFDDAEVKRRFAEGDKFTCHLRLQVSSNSDYGNYYGAVEVRWRLLGKNGREILRLNSVFDDLYGGTTWKIKSQEFEVPSGLTKSWYMLVCDVKMANGQTATANDIFLLNK
jgi:hypothetical protein